MSSKKNKKSQPPEASEELHTETEVTEELPPEAVISNELPPEVTEDINSRMLLLLTACCIHVNTKPEAFNAAVFLYHL